MMVAKFGRTVDMEKLETVTVNRTIEELKEKLRQIEMMCAEELQKYDVSWMFVCGGGYLWQCMCVFIYVWVCLSVSGGGGGVWMGVSCGSIVVKWLWFV